MNWIPAIAGKTELGVVARTNTAQQSSAEPSGDACDSYHRYEEDIALVARLGLTTYRYSIEWARIEPEPGAWSIAELDHYRRMAETAKPGHDLFSHSALCGATKKAGKNIVSRFPGFPGRDWAS